MICSKGQTAVTTPMAPTASDSAGSAGGDPVRSASPAESQRRRGEELLHRSRGTTGQALRASAPLTHAERYYKGRLAQRSSGSSSDSTRAPSVLDPSLHGAANMDNSTATQCPPDINAEILSQLDLGSTIGVAFLGVAISSAIYGITCIQTFQYYRSPRGSTDTPFLKIIVLVLWMLDSTHQALIVQILYHYLVLNYANALALLRTVWSIPTEIIVNAVIACIVETFFVMRIWKLSRNVYVSGACMIFTIAHLTMNLVFPIRTFFYPVLVEAETKLKSTGSSGLGVAVVADVSISVAMVWYLRKGRTGLRKSDDMIGRLIMLTITTGSFTTIFVIANLIAYLAAPAQLYVLFFNFMLGKLYINSLLTSLNSRTYVRGGNEAITQVNSIPLSTFQAQEGQVSHSNFTGSTVLASSEEGKKGYVV